MSSDPGGALDALRTLKSIDTDDPDVWTSKCQTAFDAIKESIKAAPLLARPMWQEKFFIATDASNVGLGAVLFQGSTAKPRYIVCVSRSLSASERNYSASK